MITIEGMLEWWTDTTEYGGVGLHHQYLGFQFRVVGFWNNASACF